MTAMKRKRWATLWGLLCLLALSVSLPFVARAQEPELLQQGFEGRETLWKLGPNDAECKETAHRLSDLNPHRGQRCEQIQFEARQGTYIHYLLPIGQAPLNDEFLASLWLKSNRPGLQLMARLVLPHERDPQRPGQPLTTLLRGDVYQTAGRWQRVELRQPLKLMTAQQQLLRVELRRDVVFTDAYVDQIILNAYAGPGQTDVWVDDLEVGPVLDPRKAPATGGTPATPASSQPPSGPRAPLRTTSEVKLERDQLQIDGRKFFVRGIRYGGTPLKTLRDAGFNTIWLDQDTSAETVSRAVDLGFWLVPVLSVPEGQQAPLRGQAPGVLTGFELTGRKMNRFLEHGAVLCWDLGGGLSAEQYPAVTRTAQQVRGVDPMTPVAANVWDGFGRYSRGLDQVMLGVHRWPLMTSLELPRYREWLIQRRQLAHPDTYLWTWVQTHLPEWYTRLVYDQPSSEGFQEPIGPHPEQIRLMTYAALSAGTRGLGFWSDRFLADSHQGRDRLLQLALINQELQLLEPMLMTAQPPVWVPTSQPYVKAAVMRCERGVLCLPMWMGPGAQYVPGQAAVSNLTVVVPDVPVGTQPWLISPAGVRTLRMERVTGGVRVTVPEFGLTGAIVFTGDLGPQGLVVQLQDQTRRMGRMAAQWAQDLAEEELARVTKVNAELEQEGKALPDGAALLAESRRRIDRCASHRRNGDNAQAYAEAERAMRPLRLLMRAQWDEAIKELDAPVASPYALSFYTLPRHWRFRNQIKESTLGTNVLTDGTFERPAGEAADQWRVQEEATLDAVARSASRVSDLAQEGKQSLLLEIKRTENERPLVALERTFLAVHSPAVRLPPGTIVRITGQVHVPAAITASTDGALLYDSAGGEPLAVRLTEPTQKWKRITLYRKVPENGLIHLTLALTGLGKVYFDDVKIEPLLPPTTATQPVAKPAIQPVGFQKPPPPGR